MSKRTQKFEQALEDRNSIPTGDAVFPAPRGIAIPTRKKADPNDLGHNTIMSQTGLVISPTLSLEQWQAVGKKIREHADKIQWVIGDWILYGLKNWGFDDAEGKNISNVYDIAEEITGYARRSLKRFKAVSEYFDGEEFLRRNSVPYSIHANAYEGIPIEVRDNIINGLLAEAERENWTNKKLSEVIKEILVKQLPEEVDQPSKPSRLPDARERFTSHITRVQFKRMDVNEQQEFAKWWNEQGAKITKWLDDE